MSLETDVQIGDFRIVKRLGEGGMGVVYLAEQISLKRLVALKVIGSALVNRSDIERFQREAQAVAKLSHPSISNVYFIGQDRQVRYIAMEYIDGLSLREVMKRLCQLTQADLPFESILQQHPTADDEPSEMQFDQKTQTFTPENSARLMLQEADVQTAESERFMATPEYIRRCCVLVKAVALALAHAHERGVIHRDIKPENILMDKSGHVHVIDFGIARFYDDPTMTSTGALIGTPMYMSPEQITGRIAIDHRTDIYSLGLVLYELLSLRLPNVASTREGLLRQIVTKALIPCSWLNREVNPDLQSIVHKATSKDPDERYRSAMELADDLQNVLDGKPVAAPPYRYKFDTREIAAERPTEMVYLSFFYLFFGLLWFTLAFYIESLKISALLGHQYHWIMAVWALITIVTACFVASGVGLLTGRRWARAFTVIQGILISSTLIYYLIEYESTDMYSYLRQAGYRPTEVSKSFLDKIRYLDLRSLFLLALSSVPVLLIPLLYSRRLSRWFAFAASLRGQHDRERPSAKNPSKILVVPRFLRRIRRGS